MSLLPEDLLILKKLFLPTHFTSEIEAHFQANWQYKTFQRNAFITEAGARERFIYVVLEGVQAVYLIDKEGNQIILGFTYPNEISGVYDSIMFDLPSNYFLEALTKSRLLAFPSEMYRNLFELFPEFNLWARLFLERMSYGRAKREVELLTKTSAERYRDFTKRCPEELKSIPQKYIASYLNMKPETLSRVRNNDRKLD